MVGEKSRKAKMRAAWRWFVKSPLSDWLLYLVCGLLIYLAIGGILSWTVTNITASRVIPYTMGLAWENAAIIVTVVVWLILEAIKYVKDNWNK